MDPLAALLESDDDSTPVGKTSKVVNKKKGAFDGSDEEEDIFDIIAKKKDKGKQKSVFADSDDSGSEDDFVGAKNKGQKALSVKSESRDDSSSLVNSRGPKTIDFDKLSIKDKKKNKNRTIDSKEKSMNVSTQEGSNAIDSILVTEVKSKNVDVFMNDGYEEVGKRRNQTRPQ